MSKSTSPHPYTGRLPKPFRKCYSCRRELPLSAFDPRPLRPNGGLDGYDRSCRECSQRRREPQDIPYGPPPPCLCGCGRLVNRAIGTRLGPGLNQGDFCHYVRGHHTRGPDGFQFVKPKPVRVPRIPMTSYEKRQSQLDSHRRLQQRRRSWYLSFMSGKVCQRCGMDKRLHWHHRDPSSKIMEVSRMSFNFPPESVLAEIEKCDLLCVKCHWAAHRELNKQNEPH